LLGLAAKLYWRRAEVIVAKQRSGPTGKVHLKYMRFEFADQGATFDQAGRGIAAFPPTSFFLLAFHPGLALQWLFGQHPTGHRPVVHGNHPFSEFAFPNSEFEKSPSCSSANGPTKLVCPSNRWKITGCWRF
jgi:hypothetical protein